MRSLLAPADRRNRARAHWYALSESEKRQAIIDLSAIYSPHIIAAACGVSVEAVREILAERAAP